MASVRETGWEAFQQGNIDEAIRLLGAACQEQPDDYEAHLFLGAAYGKAGRHNDAVTMLTHAVHLQPANAQARYNLGVALEQAGHVPQAFEAFRQAVTLDPNYFQASVAIHRLQPSGSEPPATPPTDETPLSTSPDWSAPPSSDYPRPLQNVPIPGYGAPTGPYAQSPAPGTLTPGFEAMHTAGGTALPTHGLLSEYTPSPNAPNGPTTVLESYSSETPPNYNDEMDVPGAFRDFGRILATPDRFFREQAGRNGLMSPILMVGLYLVLQLVCSLVQNGAQGLIGFAASLIFSPISLAIAGAWMVAMYLVTALLVHFLGWIFGNRQDFSISFRACVYADAPRFLVTVLVSLYMAFFILPSLRANPISPAEMEHALGLPPGTMAGTGAAVGGTAPGGFSTTSTYTPAKPGKRGVPRGTSPAGMPNQPTPDMLFRMIALLWNKFGAMMAVSIAFSVAGWVWSTVLLILAIHRLQRISAPAAIGVVFLMYALVILLIALVIFGFAGLIFALINWGMHSGGAAGGGLGR